MASRRPFSYPRYQAWGDNETFLNGGTIEFFDAGTSNNRNIYQDAALTTTAPNPVTLNSRGEPQSAGGTAIDIYLDEQPYKIVLKDSAGITKHTIDNYVNPESLLVPQDPTDATDQSTDVFEGTLSSDPSSGEVFVVDFQTANTTTTPTFENTAGSLGALTIKTRDGSALWSGALNGVHELKYDGADYLVSDPYFGQNLSTSGTVTFRGNDPEHATDGGTDAFASATNTTVPSDGQTIVRDFQSANTTTTPTLDSKTMTTRDGSALWSGAVSGPHELQRDQTADTYLVLEPLPLDGNQPASVTYVDAGDPTLDTEVDATNGGANDLTEVDFTGIKSGAKRISIILNNVSLDNGTDHILVQIGDSGGFEVSGYASTSVYGTGTPADADSSAGFVIGASSESIGTRTVMTLYLRTSLSWNSVHTGRRTTSQFVTGGGAKGLSAELDRIRITSTGAAKFDDGQINILVE